jgi:type I restriction enzyme R subunit
LEEDVVKKLSSMRIAFLIDEIHRSNSGTQHEEMISVFDELQNSFDKNEAYIKEYQKKNLIVGFTATPSDLTLARFGEYNKYAEAEKIWIPFDSYTMREAIEDGYILNPIKGIVPVSSKMYFEVPDNELEGFEGDTGYVEVPDNTDTGIDEYGKKYAIRKKKIYSNTERVEAIAKFIVERLVTTVYHNIRGTAKAMLAVSSIPNAIQYKRLIAKQFAEIVKQKKYDRFKEASVYIVYSDSQDQPSSHSINGGISEKDVMQAFKLAKNGIIIVVDKLQTGYDEPKLHTLFLDKEIRGINAIQTISRVNRTTKHKNDCKIVDFSYKNVNVKNIKAAFEHFSNVVVSDFDPLGDESKLEDFYKELRSSALFIKHFKAFEGTKTKQDVSHTDVEAILNMQNDFADFITKHQQEAKRFKKIINAYFKILNLIEFVLDLDKKYGDAVFLEFWRKFNNEFNQINKSAEIIDDVEIYFDNRIGIIVPQDYVPTPKVKSSVAGEPSEEYGKKYKFNILKVIEKRNKEEEAIAELIKEFEAQVEAFFTYIPTDEVGKRLIAKIKDGGVAFSQEEVYQDFAKVYRKYTIIHKNLSDFFKRETKDSLNQLCDDFEKVLLQP